MSQRRQLESLFAKDTADAYRVFDTMEHFLRQPEHLRGQLQVQLGGATQVRRRSIYAAACCSSPSTTTTPAALLSRK